MRVMGKLSKPDRAMKSASIPQITFNRPSNTTAYTGGDVIGVGDAGTPANAGSAIHFLPGAGFAGGYMFVQSLKLIINAASVPSGMAGFRVHVYDRPPTAILDNAAYAFVAADVPGWQDTFDIGTPAVRGSLLRAQARYQGSLIRLGAGPNTGTARAGVYVVLETSGGFTPASATAFTLRIDMIEAGY